MSLTHRWLVSLVLLTSGIASLWLLIPGEAPGALIAPQTQIIVTRDSQAGILIDALPAGDQVTVSSSFSGDTRTFLISATAGGSVLAGAGCQQGTSAVVSCSAPISGSQAIRFVGEGGDDSFLFNGPDLSYSALSAGPNIIDGGPGSDFLVGTSANDTILGGDGSFDELHDGEGADTLSGDAGDDRLLSTAEPPLDKGDVFDGGPGSDVLSYHLRSRRVSVSLDDVANDGRALAVPPFETTAEGDNVHGDIERVIGSEHDDVITAAGGLAEGPSTGIYTFEGLGGDDVLTVTAQAAGILVGGPGTDTLGGGPLADQLNARDGLPDALDCGAGTDFLDADLRDAPPPSCESVSQGAVREGPNVVISGRRAKLRRGGRLRIRLCCPRAVGHLGCSGRLVGRLAASHRNGPPTRYSIRARRSRTVTLRLGARDARRIRRLGRGKVRIASVERGHFGPKTTIRQVAARAR